MEEDLSRAKSAEGVIEPPCDKGYSLVALDNPKNGVNVGSVMRAAGCYGVSGVFAGGGRIKKSCKIGMTDTMKSHRRIPLTVVNDVSEIDPFNCEKVAVDLVEGATPLSEFKHPKQAMYIFGPEDGTLGARVIDKCQHKIYIPTNGCMNLAATVNVVLYDRLSKLATPRPERSRSSAATKKDQP